MWLSQVLAVSWLNLRSLRQRLGSSIVAVIGIGGVVAILVAVLSISEGFRKTVVGSGSTDTVIILRSGSSSEMMSGLRGDEPRLIKETPGLLRGERGAVASAELYVIIDLIKRSSGTAANVPLRGVEPAAFQVRPEVKIVEGRMFERGRMEVIAGASAARQFEGLEVGSQLKIGDGRWKVVGHFAADGSLSESELWGDVRVLQPAYRRGNSFQSIYAKLESADAFDQVKTALTSNPRLSVDAQREADYYAAQSRTLSSIVNVLGALLGALMGGAAAFAAWNTMYTAVAARTREIATLRALGFNAGPVVVSVLAETVFLGVLGGALGGTLAYFGFNGLETSTMNWDSFSQVAFAFAVTPRLLFLGVTYALLIGIFGGLHPAWRAARLPVASALRQL